MKKLVHVVWAVVLVLALALPALAQEKKAEEAKPAAPAKTTTRGTVSSVDAAGNKLVLAVKQKGETKDVTIKVTDKTTIRVGKEKKALADLKQGDRATVVWTKEGEENVASSVRVSIAKPAAAAKPAGPAKPAETK